MKEFNAIENVMMLQDGQNPCFFTDILVTGENTFCIPERELSKVPQSLQRGETCITDVLVPYEMQAGCLISLN